MDEFQKKEEETNPKPVFDLYDQHYKTVVGFECIGDDGGSRVCALNAGSFLKKETWVILLQSMYMDIGKFSYKRTE